MMFNPLDKEVLRKIVDKMLGNSRPGSRRRIYVTLGLGSKSGSSSKVILSNTGRPIKRYIQKEIETAIAKAIIGEEIIPNNRYKIDVKDDKLTVISI